MPPIFQYEHVVTDSELDGLGHVNNVEYVRWMIDAAVAHSSAQGWPPQRYREIGAAWVVRSHTIEYLRPALAGDHVVVHTWVANFKKIQSLRKYKIVRPADAAVLVLSQTNWAFIDTDRRMPRRVPPELGSAFHVVPQDAEP